MIHIAHRGAPLVSSQPPNSRAAFSAALEQGFTHVETDLRLNASGQIVLAHDVEESESGEPLDVAWPVLSQFTWINLEIKEDAVVEPLLVWLQSDPEKVALFPRLVISSFEPTILAHVHDLLPALPLAALLYPWQDKLDLPAGVRPASIHLTKEFAVNHPQRPQSIGEQPVMVFTVNDQGWSDRLPSWVSGIFTDSLLPPFFEKS